MIHLFPWPHNLQALVFFHLILQWIHLRNRRRGSQQRFMELFQIISFCSATAIEWIEMIYLVLRFFKLRTKKRRLFKPHMLLRILTGYRANLLTKDVWNLLQNNWKHFYWLTGETPHSLNILVNRVQANYFPQIQRGRTTGLDFKNQVCSMKSF